MAQSDIDRLLQKIISQPLPTSAGGGTANSDLNKYSSSRRSRGGSAQARRVGNDYLSGDMPNSIFSQSKIVEERKQEAHELARTNPDLNEDTSWLGNVLNALDFTGKHVAEPLMGSVLSNVFALTSKEEAGERALREAGARNPLAMIFSPQRREKVREALKETKLAPGFYTGMRIAFDPLTFVPLGLPVKGVKAAGKLTRLGIGKPLPTVSKPLKDTGPAATRLIDTLNIQDRVDLSTNDNWMSKLGSKLVDKPIVGPVASAINPSIASKSEIGRDLIGYMQIVEDGDNLAKAGISQIAAMKNPFRDDMVEKFYTKPVRDEATGKITEKGRLVKEFSEDVIPVKGFIKVEGVGDIHWLDLFKDYETVGKNYKQFLNKEQRAFIEEYRAIVRESRGLLDANGVKVAEIGLEEGETFIPRKVLGTLEGVNDLKQNIGKQLGAKASFLKTRYYETALEGVEAGVQYNEDMLGVLAIHLRGIYRTTADKKLSDLLKKQGYGTIRRIPDEVRHKRVAARREIDRLAPFKAGIKEMQSLEQQLRRIKKGSAIRFRSVAQSGLMRSMIKRDPELAERFKAITKMQGRSASQIEKRYGALQSLADDIAKQSVAADGNFKSATKAFSDAFKRSKQTPLGQARLTKAPAMTGRFFDPKEAAEIESFFGNQAANWATQLGKVNDVGRMAITGFDFGAGMIQGFPLLAKNPAAWVRAQSQSLRSLFNPQAADAYRAKNAATYQEMAQYGVPISDAEQVVAGAVQAGQAAPLLGGVKFIGAAAAGAARAFNTFGDVARREMWEAMKPVALRGVKEGDIKAADKALNELAEFISKATGVTPNSRLGIRASQAAMERAIGFAPRYYRASFGLMADVFQGGLKGQLARQTVSNMMAAGVVFHHSMAIAFGQEPNLDPRKAEFLTVDIGGQKVGMGTVWLQMARQMGKIYHQTMDERDPGKMISFSHRENPLLGFARGRTAPGLSYGWDIATGRDFLGRPVRPGTVPEDQSWYGPTATGALRRLTPLWMQDMVERLPLDNSVDNPSNLLVSIPGEILGMRTMPNFISDRVQDRREELSQQYYGKEWNSLEPIQQETLRTGNRSLGFEGDSQLVELEHEWAKYGLDQAPSLRLSTSIYFDEKRKAKADNVKNINTAVKGFEDGVLSPKEFRDKISEYGQQLGNEYQRLDKLEQNKPVLASLAERAQKESTEEQAIERVFADKFFSRVTLGADEVDEETGTVTSLHDEYHQYNFEERERRIASIQEELRTTLENAGNGDAYEDIWRRIEIRIRGKHDIPEPLRQLEEGREVFGGYWEIGEDLAEQAGILDIWRQYKRFRGRPEGDALAERFPLLQQIERTQDGARQQMRKSSPALDAWLFRYGYTSTLQNKTAKNLGEKLIASRDFDPFSLSLD
jgi:hypothetical protein